MKEIISIVTGSRADYGLLEGVISNIQNSRILELELVVTGSHLSNTFGKTVDEIAIADLKSFVEIDLNLDMNKEADLAYAIGDLINKISNHYSRNKPSLTLVLGDRYEILAASIACATLGIPIGHIHGGEITDGSKDDMYRHVITKLASVHFVANKEFGIRVQSMGENPNNVHVVGGLGIDSINRTRILPKSDLETKLGFELWPKYSMLTFHPDSVNPDDTFTQLEILLNSIGHFPDVQFIITGANADFHGSQINEFLAKKSLNSSNIIFFKSLGQQNFLSLLSESQFVLGNSSSGLLEAPTFGIPTVNIGGRQNGRPKAISVIDVDCNVTSITQGITKALSKDFQRTIANCSNPYGTYGASDKILSILESLNFKSLLPKYFIDK